MPQPNPTRDQLSDHDAATFQLLLSRLSDSLAQDLSAAAAPSPAGSGADPAGGAGSALRAP
ncbi:hypothetical protein AB0K43_25450 [Kitasatospora sp. NPDC049258]|uniref:hypothetical protein n=1 Tax=Kitasatospora sp. NPDC049258 TaxID=3155394 RepID=UPI00343C8F65